MIEQVVAYARTYDHAFGGSAPPDPDGAVLAEIFARPGVSDAVPLTPFERWGEIEKAVTELSSRDADDLPSCWIALAKLSAEASAQPLASAIGLLYALAALESVSKGDFYWALADGARPEWHEIGLVFATTLIRLKAIWSADLFIRRTLDTIQATNRYRHGEDADIRERAADYISLAGQVQELRRGAVQALSAELVRRHSELSGGLAALLWTLGQPIEAEGVAAGDTPSKWIIESVIDDSLRRGDWDPLTQDTWSALQQKCNFSLDDHRLLYGKLTAHVGLTTTRRVDIGSDPPVSRTYALTALMHFGSGSIEDVRNQFEFVRDNWIPVLMQTQSSDALRILALDVLVARPPEERPARMAELAKMASALVQQARMRGANDSYDHSFDGIFGHLSIEPEGHLEQTLDLIELYRVSGIAYWLTTTRPALPEGHDVQELLQREESLLIELRGARFARLIGELPRHYQKYSINADIWEKFGNPFDQQRAVKRLQEIVEELKVVWSEINGLAPNYAKARRSPGLPIDDFAELLTQTDRVLVAGD